MLPACVPQAWADMERNISTACAGDLYCPWPYRYVPTFPDLFTVHLGFRTWTSCPCPQKKTRDSLICPCPFGQSAFLKKGSGPGRAVSCHGWWHSHPTLTTKPGPVHAQNPATTRAKGSFWPLPLKPSFATRGSPWFIRRDMGKGLQITHDL